MENEEIKRKLMGLWEKSTHNSKELLGNLFDYYFDDEYIEYKENDGKIISAICGIPYEFGFGEHKLRGLYLISLTTEEGYKKRGVLSELLKNINERMKLKFDFTFLIPGTELFADYYGTQGYYSSFFILEERYTPLHNFRNDYLLSLVDSDERIKELKMALLDEIEVIENDVDSLFKKEDIIEFILSIEHQGNPATNLCHTFKDLEYILGKDSIVHLNSYIAYDSDKGITGVGFTKKTDLKHTRIEAIYLRDMCSYYAILDYIKQKNPDHSISVITSEVKYQSHSIIQQIYSSANDSGGDLDNTISAIEIPFNINKLLQPMGMVQILNYDKILEYIARTRSDVEFKLRIRDYEDKDEEQHIDHSETFNKDMIENNVESKINNGNCLYIIQSGKLKKERFKPSIKDQNILDLSKKEVSELLLRKNDSSNLIMEAFGIPRLNLQIRLLPC